MKMNSDSKKIVFNKSTLISLKAELLRKREEVDRLKPAQIQELKNYKPPAPSKCEPKEKSSFIKKLEEVDPDEIETNKKIRDNLERKTRLYDSLSENPAASKYSSNFLVQFEQKEKENKNVEKEEIRENAKQQCTEIDDDIGPPPFEEGNDEWVEFTDCMGRVRKCHRNDLEDYKTRDLALRRKLSYDDNVVEDIKAKPKETSELVEKTNEYIEKMREKWEEQERLLKEKDGDIHYQDLLFDEAREHGVGYYNFSSDEVTRRKEQAELERIRKETEAAQKETAQLRLRREKEQADRVKAAKARRRARLGLPPEDVEKEDLTASILDFITEQKKVSTLKAKEEEEKKREQLELERQKERESYVREWDVGKEKDELLKNERFKTLTQEEYLDREREKRIKEFAPPKQLDMSNNDMTKNVQPKTWEQVRPTPTASQSCDDFVLSDDKKLYFSSKLNKFKNRNVEAVPIINELVDNTTSTIQQVPLRSKKKPISHGAEIAPPALFEYYTPEAKKSRNALIDNSKVKESYELGLKKLEGKGKGPDKKDYFDDFIF